MTRSMTRVIFLGAAILALLFLAGCDSGGSDPVDPPKSADTKTDAKPDAAKAKKPSAEKVKLILWHSYRAEEQQALQQAVKNFNGARTDIEVETLKIPHQAFADKITAAIPRNNGPDLFIFAHDRVGDWAESGHVEPISTWAKSSLLKEFLPQTVKALVYKKSLYGLPLAFKSVVLYYNKDLVKTPPATLDDLIKVGTEQTDASQKRYGLVYENTSLYFSAPWIHAFGGQVMDEQDKLHLTEPGTVEGLGFARDLLEKHKIVPEDVDSNLVTNLFNEGRAAMAINGPWFRGEISDKVSWGVVTMPAHKGKFAAPFLGSEGVLMSSKSKHKEEAFEVMKYLAGTEGAKVRMKAGGQPVAHKGTWDSGIADETQKVFRAQLDQSVVMPNTPKMRLVWSPMDQAIYKIVKNGKAPAEALQSASDGLKAP